MLLYLDIIKITLIHLYLIGTKLNRNNKSFILSLSLDKISTSLG